MIVVNLWALRMLYYPIVRIYHIIRYSGNLVWHDQLIKLVVVKKKKEHECEIFNILLCPPLESISSYELN